MEQTLDGMSMDIEQMQREKLRAVFPDCFSDGKLDIDKLLSLCGEYIDNDFEKYRFEWPGKSECLKLAQKRSTGTLRPCPEESKDWDTTQNLYIEGDNLEVLKLLQTAYFRRVKMIYIDPPYNTGNDFVYKDDFSEPLAKYREVTQQTTKSNPETMGRYHTNWLNMMYPRLRLAANLLRDDGVIFISIDDHEVHNLRKLCDETLGEENFIADIIWQKKYAPKSDSKFLSESHDHILFYARSLEQCTLHRLPKTAKQNDRYKNMDNDPRGPWKPDNVLRNEFRDYAYFPVTLPCGEQVYPPSGTSWRYTKEKFDQLIADNRIWFGKDGTSRPAYKRFLSEVSNTIPATTLWQYDEVGHNDSANKELRALFETSVPFDTPKPSTLIKRILQIGSDPDSLILDFFSGSATTAHAVMQLNAEDGGNRQFICVQLPELCDEKSEAYKAGFKNICEIGKERIRRAAAKIHNAQCTMQNEENEQTSLEDNSELRIMNYELDLGFRVFKLDSSNLRTWDSTPIPDDNLFTLYERMNAMIQNVKPERSDVDMVYEIMLKMGIPLTYPVTTLEIGDHKTAYSVGEECLLLVCLAPQITPEDVEEMAEFLPLKIVLSKNSFADDTAMSNAFYILRDRDIKLKLV
ncbi:MAG: site-specific DNA-methyltransferase [Hydrogeniiclostridium mannosilyticum]